VAEQEQEIGARIDQIEQYIDDQLSRRKNLFVPFYLICAYQYEISQDPIVSDGYWDSLCKKLDLYWDTIDHHHKYLIDRASLITATASYLTDDRYPEIVKSSAARLRRCGPPPVGGTPGLPWYEARSAVPILARWIKYYQYTQLLLCDVDQIKNKTNEIIGHKSYYYAWHVSHGITVVIGANPLEIQVKYEPEDELRLLAVGDDVVDAVVAARRYVDDSALYGRSPEPGHVQSAIEPRAITAPAKPPPPPTVSVAPSRRTTPVQPIVPSAGYQPSKQLSLW